MCSSLPALLDCENSVAEAEGASIASLGIRDIEIVTTKDPVLVASKDRALDSKKREDTF